MAEYKERILSQNLLKLRESTKQTQGEFAEKLGITTPTLSEYERGNKLPKLDFLLRLVEVYHISLDDFVFNANFMPPIRTEEEANVKKVHMPESYTGNYFLYLYDTDEQFNAQEKTNTSVLTYGIMSVISGNRRTKERDSLDVIACFSMNSSQVNALYDKAEMIIDTPGTDIYSELQEAYHENATERIYLGKMTVAANKMFLLLDYGNTDRALIIMNTPPNIKEHYVGGLGTINSVSRGCNPVPCVQCIGISYRYLKINPEEIAEYLSLGKSLPFMEEEAAEFMQLFRLLYIDNRELSQLSDLDKRCFIQAKLENYFRKYIQRNLFRIARIEMQADNSWYHLIQVHGRKYHGKT